MKYSMNPYGIEDENLDAKLKELVKGNALTDHKVDDDIKEQRYAVFGAICDLKEEAQDMYCEGELSWDKMCKAFAQAMTDLVGKEKELQKAHDKDEEEAEGEEEDDKEDEKEEDDK